VGLLPTDDLVLGQESKADKPKNVKVARFIKELHSRDRNSRWRRARTLRQIGPNDEGGVPQILEALNTGNKNVRAGLVDALGRIGPAAVPHLVEAVDHTDTLTVRLGAITALGYIHARPEVSIPCLVRALANKASEVRRVAIFAIQRFEQAAEEAVPDLAAIAIKDPDAEVRVAAVNILGHVRLKPEISVPCLIKALADDRSDVRREATVALARFGSDAKPAVAAIARAVDDMNQDVRASALKVLKLLGPTAEGATPTLLVALRDQDRQRSHSAAAALRSIGVTHKQSIDSLLTATNETHPHVRRNAAWALGVSGNLSQLATPRLLQLLQDEDPSVVRATLLVLAEFGPDAAEAATPIIEATKSDDHVVKVLAEEALRKVDPERAFKLFGKRFDPVQTRLNAIQDAHVGEHDWPQLGGSRYRNNTPAGTNIPTNWNVGEFDRRTGEWNSDEAVNIKWVARLGSQSYGNPVAANGKIYVGTNNGAGYLKRYPTRFDLGCLLCFRESDGESCGSTPAKSCRPVAFTTGQIKASAPRQPSKVIGCGL
jgi:HEAT repeat protein